jgi:hypothetical protein
VNDPNFVAVSSKVCDGDFFVHVFNIEGFRILSSDSRMDFSKAQ